MMYASPKRGGGPPSGGGEVRPRRQRCALQLLEWVVQPFGDDPSTSHASGLALRGQPLSQLALTAPLSGEPFFMLIRDDDLCLP